MLTDDELTERIIGGAFEVHNHLGPGYLEAVYENALAIELRPAGLHLTPQARIEARYKAQVVGAYVADLLVEERTIVELKAVRSITPAHEIQLVNYLTATGRGAGLLIDFGKSVGVKRRLRECRESGRPGQ